MKKSIFVQLCMSLLFLLLVPAVGRSQELTEAQIKERCGNNFKRLEELKSNLKVVEIELLQMWEDKQIEDAREKMVTVGKAKKSMRQSKVLVDEKIILIIASQYNFSYEKCLKRTFDFYCLDELENIIEKKIDNAVALKAREPELTANKKNIEKQIQEHKANLVALGCVQASGDCTIPKISGKYSTDGDPRGVLVFTQSGSYVTGRYGKDENSLINNLSGDFVCGTLTGTFTNTAYKVTGTFTYNFTANGSSYTGSWKNDSDGRTGPAGGHKQ